MPNGLIDDASLRVHPDGLALALTIPWYRSLWLSSVTTIRLTIDGADIPEADLAFELDGVRYDIADLPHQSDVLWYLQSHPLLVVRRDPPVEPRRDARDRAARRAAAAVHADRTGPERRPRVCTCRTSCTSA